MRRFRLTKAAKILLTVIIVALIGGGVVAGIKTGFIKTESESKAEEGSKEVVSNKTETKPSDAKNEKPATNTSEQTDDGRTINLSLDEWTGWKSIIDANGGLTTQEGSEYAKRGLNVNISIINDATQSSNALINGSLNAAGYTINRTAFLSQKFKEAGFEIVMPYMTNYSNGGDGIIAKSSITKIEDLVGAKVGVPQFSEAHSLVVWFVNQSDLTEEQKNSIIDNLIYFETPDECAKAFFAGQVDVSATWEPYLTQAENMTDSHILFSTKTSSNLIMDGIVFNKEFAETNPDAIRDFIDGSLAAADMYATEFNAIRKVMPMFSTSSDEDIIASTQAAKLTTWADNMDLLKGTAKSIYTDMCDVWSSIGESVDYEIVDELFDTAYMEMLTGVYNMTDVSTGKNTVVVTEDNKQDIINAEALLTKSASVQFVINTAKFTDSAAAAQTLDDFIKVAKIIDGAIIEIAGNTDPNLVTDPTDEYNIKLSWQRAEAVKQYFVLNGISADRIVTVGNGSSNPIVENDTDEHKAMNRRTDVSFKIIEN